MALPHKWNTRAREKLAVVLLSAFLLGWIAISLSITVAQIHHYGYGSGITNRGHLPAEIKVRFGHPDAITPKQLLKETSR